jgi:hypothetical protein
VQFTGEMARNRRVPATYVHDVLSMASRELQSVRQQILEMSEVDERSRIDAADACSRLATAIADADRARRIPDEGELRKIEVHLRDAAQRVRTGAAVESRP